MAILNNKKNLKNNKSESKKEQQKKKLKRSSRSDDEQEDDEEYETLSESDSEYVPIKKNKNKKNKKKYQDSDDEDSDENDIDHAKVQKLVSKLFPSKYMNEKVKRSQTNKRNEKKKSSMNLRSNSKNKKKYQEESEEEDSEEYEEDSEEDEEDSEEDIEDSEEDEEDSDEYEEDSEEDEEDSEEDEEDSEEEEGGILNIVLALDNAEDEAEKYVEDDDDCDSDDEQAFMKETYEKVGSNDNDNKKKKKQKRNNSENEDIVLTDVEQEYLELVETKKSLAHQLVKKPNSKILKNAIQECKNSINKLIKKARSKNAKTYHKLIHNHKKKKTNEIDYFRRKLSNKEQLRVMKDLKEINGYINIDKPYRLALLDSKMPAKFKATAMQKLNVLKTMEPGDPEYYKIKNWVDTFMRIPFGIYKNFDIKLDDGIDTCNTFMTNAKQTLDDCVFGLNDAKLQIMQMMGQWISNPSAMGTAIAIKGPMGTGKTTLVKDGISKILGRDFSFIALGGATDSSFLEGHSYTYEGSTWGKIVQFLIDSKCMNPVIYFDELDKISDTPKGEEITGILTHLTDTSQNNEFHDKYFSEVNFDLSKCLFIFSYNDESKVNPILRDRMYRIQTKGYDSKEKIIIARNHLLPKIREQVNFTEEDIIIPDETLSHIISNEAWTKKEDGVRNLKRCLEIIYTKLNLFRLVKPDSKMFEKDLELDVKFPFTVDIPVCSKLIKTDGQINMSMLSMYI